MAVSLFRGSSMSRHRPSVLRLEDRLTPSVANGDFYWADGRAIALNARAGHYAVRLEHGQAAATLTTSGGLLAGYDIVQALDPTVVLVTPAVAPRANFRE